MKKYLLILLAFSATLGSYAQVASRILSTQSAPQNINPGNFVFVDNSPGAMNRLWVADFNALRLNPVQMPWLMDTVLNRTNSLYRSSTWVPSLAQIPGLQTALNGKISIGATIPYSTLSGAPVLAAVATSGNYADLTGIPTSFASTIALIPGLRSELDSKQPIGNYLIRATADGLYKPLTYSPTSAEITTALGYTPYNSSNPAGYITSAAAPVQSVNGQTGAVTITTPTLTAAAINTALGYIPYNGAANPNGYVSTYAALPDKPVIPTNTNQLTNGAGFLVGGTNIPFTKVRAYQVTSNATTSIWTLNTGTDFTTIFDVQVQAVSVSNTTSGIRSATINAWTSTSNSFSGVTHGSQLVGGAILVLSEGLRLIPSTNVRITVYGN